MVMRQAWQGRLANRPFSPHLGFNPASSGLTRVLLIADGVFEHAYYLASGDQLSIFEKGQIVWNGVLPEINQAVDKPWIHPNVAEAQWNQFFSAELKATVVCKKLVNVTMQTPPKEVPQNVDPTLVQHILQFLDALKQGKSGLYELAAARSQIDPVLLKFLCDWLKLNVGSTRKSPLLTELIAVLRSPMASDRPKWLDDAAQDPIYQWFFANYDLEQFSAHPDLAIKILLDKIES